MRFKEVKKLIKESTTPQEQDLFEINMSPSNLEKLAGQIDAKAGMEFEMIVPDVGSADGNDSDLEPVWDEDRRVYGLRDVEDFFFDGDFNSRREVARLIEYIQEQYEESLYDDMSTAWSEQGLDLVLEYVRENMDTIDGLDDFRMDAEDDIRKANPDLPEGSDEYQELVSTRFQELVDEWAEEQFNNDTGLAQQIREEFEDEYRNDHDIDDWLRENYSRMTDIEANFDITWPFWANAGGEEVDIGEIADEFGRAVGTDVNWSYNYHGAKRDPKKYVVEPDGSLNPDDDNDAGLEFVSPPLSLEQMLTDLDKVKKWADSRNCYTNKSTGLHINVSVPGLSTEKLDYVKLALLLGDKYVLDQFGRLGNTYAKSAMDMVKERVVQRPEDAAALLNKMKQGLDNVATKIIHSGETNKYTSINTKGGYVEFRSPGGDWLSDDFFNKIKPTLLRFIVALDAAMDPQKYREEYLKKLYQLLQPKSQDDTLSYFAKYAAGELPKAALKSFVRRAQLERKVSKEPAGAGKQYWWEVLLDNGQRMEVVAGSKEVARDVAAKEWVIDPDRIRLDDISVIKPYVPDPAQARSAAATTIANANTTYEIIERRTMRPVFRFGANSEQEAARKYRDWLAGNNLPEDTEDYGWRPIEGTGSGSSQTAQPPRSQAGGEFSGAWKIVDDTGREVHRFSGVGNSQVDANRVALRWIVDNGRTNEEHFVLPIMRD